MSCCGKRNPVVNNLTGQKKVQLIKKSEKRLEIKKEEEKPKGNNNHVWL